MKNIIMPSCFMIHCGFVISLDSEKFIIHIRAIFNRACNAYLSFTSDYTMKLFYKL